MTLAGSRLVHSTAKISWRSLLFIPLGLLLMGADSGQSTDATPSLQGRWAKKVVMTAVSDPPIVGKVTSRTVTLLRVDLSQPRPRRREPSRARYGP